MTHDYYALSPESEARLAAEDYDDTVESLDIIGSTGLITGDWTGFADAFQQLQDTARTAIVARHLAAAGAR